MPSARIGDRRGVEQECLRSHRAALVARSMFRALHPEHSTQQTNGCFPSSWCYRYRIGTSQSSWFVSEKGEDSLCELFILEVLLVRQHFGFEGYSLREELTDSIPQFCILALKRSNDRSMQ